MTGLKIRNQGSASVPVEAAEVLRQEAGDDHATAPAGLAELQAVVLDVQPAREAGRAGSDDPCVHLMSLVSGSKAPEMGCTYFV